jgi:hypothetical protein
LPYRVPAQPEEKDRDAGNELSLYCGSTQPTGGSRYAWSIDVRDDRIFAIREYMDSHYVATLFGGRA